MARDPRYDMLFEPVRIAEPVNDFETPAIAIY